MAEKSTAKPFAGALFLNGLPIVFSQGEPGALKPISSHILEDNG